MFFNFGAVARLPLVESNAIAFSSPLFTVALAAIILNERVRIYRWSAVVIGFVGVLVVLLPHLSGEELTAAAAGASFIGVIYAICGSVANAGTAIQTRRLAQSESTSSIVFYFSLSCALAGLATLPFGWITPSVGETVALISIGVLGGAGHIFLTESYRYASASLVAPFDYTAMIWALVLGYAMFGETPTVEIIGGSAIIAAAGLFLIWRERQLAGVVSMRPLQPVRLRPSERLKCDDGSRVGYAGNALDLFRDEVTDIGRRLDIELYQQVEVPGCRIDFGSDLGIGQLARDLIRFAELAFDLYEKWDHARLRNEA